MEVPLSIDKASLEQCSMVQTRSTCNGFALFYSVKDAYEAYQRDKTIWKISWNDNRFYTRACRIGPIREEHKLEELRLHTLSKEYATCKNPKEIFWVNEPMELIVKYAVDYAMADGKTTFNTFTKEDAIIEVLTDEQFQNKYC